MAMRVSARFAPHDENAAAVTGKSAQKGLQGPTAGGLKPAVQRPKLSNITNKLPPTPQLKKPLGSKADAGVAARTPLRNISNEQHLAGRATPLKLDSSAKPVKQLKPQQRIEKGKAEKKQEISKLPAGPFPIPEELERKAEMWAKEGIERVHFTGDEMEALREKFEHEEMEKRVKTALSFRTEIFPTWPRPAPTDEPFDGDGKLKLDPYEETYKCEPVQDYGREELNEDGLDKLLVNMDHDQSFPSLPQDAWPGQECYCILKRFGCL